MSELERKIKELNDEGYDVHLTQTLRRWTAWIFDSVGHPVGYTHDFFETALAALNDVTEQIAQGRLAC